MGQVVLTFGKLPVVPAKAGTQKPLPSESLPDFTLLWRTGFRPRIKYGVTFIRRNDAKCQHCLIVEVNHAHEAMQLQAQIRDSDQQLRLFTGVRPLVQNQ